MCSCFAASGKEKVKNFREKETERPKKRVLKVVLLWTETGENSRLSLRECGYFWHPFHSREILGILLASSIVCFAHCTLIHTQTDLT